MTITHTPTPWKLENGHSIIADHPFKGAPVATTYKLADNGRAQQQIPQEANASFIVRACNAHDELLAAATSALNLMRMTYSHATDIPKAADTVLPALEAAIAKAEGK